jgi:hypothetical protein
MNPSDVYELLGLRVQPAERETTLRALAAFERLKIDERVPLVHRSDDYVFRSFGNQGINTIRVPSAHVARQAAHAAGIDDYYEVRKLEVSVEMLASALLAKPYLKADEFTYLIGPWASVLPEEVRSTEGCNTDEPPPPPKAIPQLPAKERKAQDKKAAREQRKAEREAAREERRAARAEQRVEQQTQRKLSAQQKAQLKLAGKLNAPAPPPLPSDEDIINAALGVTAVIPRDQAREPRAPVTRTRTGWAEPPDGQVRIMWARRDQRWWIVLPESNARVCEEKFEQLDAAQAFAASRGWTVGKVQQPRGSEEAA